KSTQAGIGSPGVSTRCAASAMVVPAPSTVSDSPVSTPNAPMDMWSQPSTSKWTRTTSGPQALRPDRRRKPSGYARGRKKRRENPPRCRPPAPARADRTRRDSRPPPRKSPGGAGGNAARRRGGCHSATRPWAARECRTGRARVPSARSAGAERDVQFAPGVLVEAVEVDRAVALVAEHLHKRRPAFFLRRLQGSVGDPEQ